MDVPRHGDEAMTPRPFRQVDVFTDTATRGNPVAVVLDAAGLDAAAMQRFAAWTNLSETTFVTAPTRADADYAVRIFTPRCELPFAGHPTLGTAHAVIEAGMAQPRGGVLVQECGVGPVTLSVDAAGLSFRLPRYHLSDAIDDAAATAWLGDAAGAIVAPPRAVDVGPVWMVGELNDVAVLAALRPDFARMAAFYTPRRMTGVTLFARDGDRVVVRSFAPADGIDEDPVCGSGNAAVAAYRLAMGQVGEGAAWTAEQGAAVGRDGRIRVRIADGDIHVGGACVTVIEGLVRI